MPCNRAHVEGFFFIVEKGMGKRGALAPGVLLYHICLIHLKQVLSLNLQLMFSARLAASKAQLSSVHSLKSWP